MITAEEAVVRSFLTSRLERHPRSQAVCDFDRGERYTYGDLARRANGLANALVKGFGVRKGDRVGIIAPNDMVYIDLFYATAKTGAITTAYNGMMGLDELAGLVRNESPRVVFYDPAYAEKILVLRGMEGVAVQEWVPLGETYKALLERDGSEAPFVPLGLEDILILMHTGGTTGQPKGAMLSARAVMCNAAGQQNTYGLNQSDVMFGYLPFFHTATWHTIVMPLLYAGGRLVFARKFHAEQTFDVIEREKPTMIWGVPTVYRRLAEHPRFRDADFSNITRCRCGAAPPPLYLMERYWAKGVQFCNGYGMTETGPGNLAMPVGEMTLEEIRAKRTSCGRLMIYNEARIVDGEGREVPVGTEGELLLRGGVLFSGYWNDAAATRAAMPDGWMHTGDVARVDEDGFYYVVGRKKNMYITCGENIFPAEVEGALLCHPGVKDVCVIGVPDPDRGEVGKAVVVLREGAAVRAEELRAFAAERLPSIKRPRYYVFADEIPKSSLGKMRLDWMREKYGSAGE